MAVPRSRFPAYPPNLPEGLQLYLEAIRKELEVLGVSGGASIRVEEGGAVVSTAANVLNFFGSDFNLTHSPVGTVNINIDGAIARVSTIQTWTAAQTFNANVTIGTAASILFAAGGSGTGLDLQGRNIVGVGSALFGSAVFGTDPGGSEVVRVATSLRIGNTNALPSSAGLVIANTAASLANISQVAGGRIDNVWYDSAAAVDEKRWDISVDGVGGAKSFSFIVRSDAGTAGTQWLRAMRTANAVDSVALATSGVAVTLDATSLYPTVGAPTLGKSGNRYGKLWGEDANFSNTAVTVGIFGTTTTASLALSGQAANTRDFLMQTNGVSRWVIRTNATAEAGADAGSDLQFLARDDTGALIDSVITITRAAGGAITLARPLSTPSSITITGTGTLRLADPVDLTLSSTGHGFQIGASSSLNIAMDGNEIMARSNGAASGLNFNTDGGGVTIHNAVTAGAQSGSLIIGGGSGQIIAIRTDVGAGGTREIFGPELVNDTAGGATGPIIRVKRARGTGFGASRAAVQLGDELMAIGGQGFTGSAYANGGYMLVVATEAWSGTANGAEIIFQTVTNTTTGVVTRWRLTNDGHWYAQTTNAYDIGATGGNKPRDIFVARDVNIAGELQFTAAASKIVPGATSISLRNNADSADNVLVSDAGLVTLRNNLHIKRSAAEPAIHFERDLTNNPRWEIGRMSSTSFRYIFADDVTPEYLVFQINPGGTVAGYDTAAVQRWSLGSSGAATGFELGRQDGTATGAFIDFHSGATAVDYDTRIIGSSGTGSIGGGTLDLIGATVRYQSTSGNTRVTFSDTLTLFARDIQVDVLGVFDRTGTRFTSGTGPVADDVLSWHGGAQKWRPRFLQTQFSNGVVFAQNNTDGTYANFAFSVTYNDLTPSVPATPIVTPIYGGFIIDMGALPPSGSSYVVDYKVNAGSYTTNRIIFTSQKMVHTVLSNNGGQPFSSTDTFTYKAKGRGSADGSHDSVYSGESTAASYLVTTEVNAFGLVLASQITAVYLSAITANIGSITAGQLVSGDGTSILQLDSTFSVPGTVTKGIFFASANPVGGGITGMYLDFTATGTNPLLHHTNFDILANGSVVMKGVLRDPNSKFVIDVGATSGRLMTIIDEQGTPRTRVKIGEISTGTSDWGIQVFDTGGATIVDMQASNMLIQDAAVKFKIDFTNRLLTVVDEQGSPRTRIKIGEISTGTADWGMEIYSDNGNKIVQMTGTAMFLQDSAATPTQGLNVQGTVPGTWTRYVNLNGSGAFAKHERLEINYDGSVKMYSSSSQPLFNLTSADFYLQNDAATPRQGILLMGTKPSGWRRYLDLVEGLLSITDEQGSPILRVKVGKVGAGSTDYGLQVFDSASATIMDFTGAKRILAVPVQPSSDSSTSISVDLSTGLTQQVRLTGTATVTLTNPVNGGRYRIWFQQDTTGSRPFPTMLGPNGEVFMYTNDTAPTLTTTPGALDLFEFEYRTDPTTRFTVMALQTNVLLPAPVVQTLLTQAFGTSSTTHNVTMPSTVNAGDLLMVIFATADGSITTTTPSGWTSIAIQSSQGAARGQVFAKIADGTEDSTNVDFVTSSAIRAAAHVYRITKFYAAGTVADAFDIATTNSSASTTPNPPSNTVAWTDRTLWIAAECHPTNTLASAYPSNYTSGQNSTQSGGGTPECVLSSCRRAPLYATTEDPGTFTIGTSQTWATFTIAIRPPA